jgi:hypothetical protein
LNLIQRVSLDVNIVIRIWRVKLFYKILYLSVVSIVLSSCTTGRLEYITPAGETKFACETEYTWQPSVDRYAVEYILAYCAKRAESKGNTVPNQQLLNTVLTVPVPPEGQVWTHELAKQRHKEKHLTDKEYGYLIAYLDLGHDKTES